MEVQYTSFNNNLGFDYTNLKKPLYLQEPVFVIVKYANKTVRFKIDKDFMSDGASIWRVFWTLIGHPFMPKFVPASIIHDYLINHPEIVNRNRPIASRIFKTVLLNSGVNPWIAQIMYVAVDYGQAFLNIFNKRWK